MKTIKKTIFILLSTFTLAFIILALRPISDASIDNCQLVKGTINEIYEAGVKDIAFRIEENEVTYYINRGLEKDLDLEDLRQRLLKQKVEIYHVQHWTPLDPYNKTKHIARLDFGENTIYNEMN